MNFHACLAGLGRCRADSQYRKIHSTPHTHILSKYETLPLLMIPLKVHTGFILVCEQRIAVYKEILTGNPICYYHQLEHQEEPEQPGSSRNAPLWVQWARPMRSAPRYIQNTQDCVYVSDLVESCRHQRDRTIHL